MVSFNRPYDQGDGTGQFLSWEMDMVGFLEGDNATGQVYDVAYTTNVDTHVNASNLLKHKAFLSVAHDEYWTWEMRHSIEQARDAGLSLGFFSADACYWQMRFAPSPLTGDPNRTIVSFKEDANVDPMNSDPSTYYLITTRFRDFHNSQPGNPEDALIGVMYNEHSPVLPDPTGGGADVQIGDTSVAPWVFANTGLNPGDTMPGLVGYEADRMYGHAPAGTIRLTHSPYIFSDGTAQYGDMTVYQSDSGSTVFATGTVQWFGESATSVSGRGFPRAFNRGAPDNEQRAREAYFDRVWRRVRIGDAYQHDDSIGDAYRDATWYGDPHTLADANRNGHGNTDRYACTDADSNSRSDRHGRPDSGCDPDANADDDVHGYSDCYRDSKLHPGRRSKREHDHHGRQLADHQWLG